MIEVKEVKGSRDIRRFVKFPLDLYKGNKYFVPQLYQDEIKLLKKKSSYEDVVESVFYLAYKDGKVAGRIQAFIQKQYNRDHNEKRIRFTRFDVIEDFNVAKALFDKAESWAREKGMDTVCGPLGQSDFEREGLLIEGFDQEQTFEEQYSYPYYKDFIERLGYVKETDWVESVILPSVEDDESYQRLVRVSKVVLRRSHLHIADQNMSAGRYLKKHYEGFFDCIEESYKDLYGVVNFEEKTRLDLIKQFRAILDPKTLILLQDEKDKIVGVGLCFPGIGKAVQKSGGRMTIPTLIKILKAVKHPEVIDLGLVAIIPEYRNSGANSVFLANMMKCLQEGICKRFETNLNLEDNKAVLDMWSRFNTVQNKRRRSYIKKL